MARKYHVYQRDRPLSDAAEPQQQGCPKCNRPNDLSKVGRVRCARHIEFRSVGEGRSLFWAMARLHYEARARPLPDCNTHP